jgi:hypothetical protein
MEDTSRRELFRIIGSSLVLTAAGSGVLSPAHAQHVHAEIAAVKSLSGGLNYVPKKFTRHHFLTLKKLGDIIIPGASDAGAESSDFLSSHNDELAAIFNGGFGWLDNYMQKTYCDSPRRHRGTTNRITTNWRSKRIERLKPPPEYSSGPEHGCRDAYYTSPAGVKGLGTWQRFLMRTFSVPKRPGRLRDQT